MSINITVHGNPVSLNRETNVISDFDYAKKTEIERRKKLRLEQVCCLIFLFFFSLFLNFVFFFQVRQQSKDIASNIRNRYEIGKRNELNRIEKVKTAELRNFNAKKIVKLQKDYRDCLASVGEAHELAARERENDKLIKQKKVRNEIIAARRGKEAAIQLKKNKEMNQRKNMKIKKNVNNVATQKDLSSEESGISDIENVPDNNSTRKKRSDSLNNLLKEINAESDSESSPPSTKVTELLKKASSLVDISSSMDSNHSTQRLFYNPQNYADDSSETIISDDRPRPLPFTQISELLNFKKQRTDFGQLDHVRKISPVDHLTINKVHSENIPPQMNLKGASKTSKSYSTYSLKPNQESIQSSASNRVQFSENLRKTQQNFIPVGSCGRNAKISEAAKVFEESERVNANGNDDLR